MPNRVAPTFYTNTNDYQVTQTYFNNIDKRAIATGSAGVSQKISWCQNTNTLYIYDPTTNLSVVVGLTNSSRFTATALLAGVPQNTAQLALPIEDMWDEFWTTYGPLDTVDYVKNPYAYNKFFGEFLADYATSYLFFDSSNTNGIINANINAQLDVNANYKRYNKAINPAQSLNQWRQYLDTIGYKNNPGPFGSVATANPYLTWQSNAQTFLTTLCSKAGLASSPTPTALQISTLQSDLTNKIANGQKAVNLLLESLNSDTSSYNVNNLTGKLSQIASFTLKYAWEQGVDIDLKPDAGRYYDNGSVHYYYAVHARTYKSSIDPQWNSAINTILANTICKNGASDVEKFLGSQYWNDKLSDNWDNHILSNEIWGASPGSSGAYGLTGMGYYDSNKNTEAPNFNGARVASDSGNGIQWHYASSVDYQGSFLGAQKDAYKSKVRDDWNNLKGTSWSTAQDNIKAAISDINTQIRSWQVQLAAANQIADAQQDLSAANAAVAGGVPVYATTPSFVERGRYSIMWVINLLMEMKTELQNTMTIRTQLNALESKKQNALNSRSAEYAQKATSITTSTDAATEANNQSARAAWQALASQEAVAITISSNNSKYLSQDITYTSNALDQDSQLISSLSEANKTVRSSHLSIGG